VERPPAREGHREAILDEKTGLANGQPKIEIADALLFLKQ